MHALKPLFAFKPFSFSDLPVGEVFCILFAVVLCANLFLYSAWYALTIDEVKFSDNS